MSSNKTTKKIDSIPAGFIDRANSPADEYFPEGVTSNTEVDVIIEHNGVKFLYTGEPAGQFGWAKEPYPGWSKAPVTHYRVVKQDSAPADAKGVLIEFGE